MSKIICDVCGTSYPETSTQCPICGCVRPGDAKPASTDNGEVAMQSPGSYTYVKGGRFSKSNVKKRNRTTQSAPIEADEQIEEAAKAGGKKDTVLIATVVVLLLAIVAVVSYIAMRVFFPDVLSGGGVQKPVNPIQNTTGAEMATTETTLPEVSCNTITVSDSNVTFDKAGAAVLLNVTTDPVDTTDEITFASTDVNIATVSADGKVVAVGPGEAVITITCGQAAAECRVTCDFEVVTPTESTAEVTYSTDDFKLNRSDFTLTKKGDSHILYNGKIPADVITWTTDNANVVTIENGKVVAVGSGMTTVYAEYGGIKLSCVVRCAASVGKAQTETTETQPTNTPYNISKTDVTIKVNEEFKLQLLDSNKKAVSVTWSVADATICSVSGDTVKGLKTGTTKISVTYEGVTYTCTVRVN